VADELGEWRPFERSPVEAQKSHQPSVIWIISYIDLITLMLSFFLMLFAMSHIKLDKWEHLVDALSTTLNPSRTKPNAEPVAEYNISTIFRKRAINLDYLSAVLEQKIDKSDVLKDSLVMLLDDRIILSLSGGRLFREGAAELTDQAGRELFELGGVLRSIENTIGVAGYSEESNFEGASYASDWELSLARAVSVANAIKRAGYGDEILSYGYGRSRNVELAGLAPERRAILSRRIDIVIMATGGSL
jgi:chemotaxis protein MotB